MCRVTIMCAAMILSFLWVASHAGLALAKYKTFEKASEQSLPEPEMTLSARSVIHCAIKCKQYPHCTVFAYNHQLSLCLLRSAMSATAGATSNNNNKQLSVYTDTGLHCPDTILQVSNGSVTIQRSLLSVEGNITCDNDYFLLKTVITCMDDGNWTSIAAQCEKSVWRYPETRMNASQVIIAIPGTVVEGWSMCVEGVPTNKSKIDIQIYQGYNNNRTVLTTWRFEGYLQVTDSVNGKIWSIH
ncbi:uncharacterized protein LOC112573913 [Pomacea canaliculata]|uniref:uncharacterized protein LOC112573913 n=1 Tax=Pomacea canaliculata TaxID=400727 RepID=UPI000D732DD5|nr:uncharacterized protein LOC112573913 [Pomacea canaliculata]